MKRSRAKWFSYYITCMLFFQNPASPLRKSYRNTMYCASNLIQQGGRLVSHYCKNRWCLVCSRMRTAMLIDAYLPRLRQCDELYFLTITRPNVPADVLSRELGDMQKIFRHIMQSRKMRQYIANGVIGIRKTECTYNSVRDDYHPHFHIMVSSKDAAEYILRMWMKLSPSADIKAQCLRKVTDLESGVKELFKYFTKLIGRDKKGHQYFDAVHMNVVFESMVGKRVFQRFGSNAAWSCEEIDEDNIEQEAALNGPGQDGDVWQWLKSSEYFGYYSVDTGEALVEVKVPEKLNAVLEKSQQTIDMSDSQDEENDKWGGLENCSSEDFEKDSVACVPQLPTSPPSSIVQLELDFG